MSLTKRQKMLSAVFLIGVGGLVADRTILRPQGGLQAASAGSLSESSSAVPLAGSVPAAEKASGPVPVAERLNNLSAGKETAPDELRDPFALPRSWSDPGAVSEERTVDTTGASLQRHQLRAVVMQNGKYCALIDDVFLVPGQSLDGFKLVSVNPDSAVFERDGKRAVLDLAVK
jgi:hypothetical protein